jgi:RecA-family ATPase
MGITPRPQTVNDQLKLVKTSESGSMQSLSAVRLDTIEAEAVDWLWEPFIARKKLTAMTGEEGIGKSWITCALASIVSNGLAFPHTSERVESSNVLLLASEDGLADTIKPRLNAVKADQTKVFSVANHFTFDELGILRFYNLISDLRPSLVIIDPFFSYLNAGLNINLATEIRPVTSKLANIAEEFNTAFLLVRHIGKSKGMGDVRAAGLGSIDFRAVCRSELLVGRDPDNKSEGAIVQIKNNLAEYGKSVGYKIIDGNITFGETTLSAERMLAAAKSADQQAETNEAVAYLREALRDGAKEAMFLKKQAASLGISEQMLRTARAKMGIEVFKRGNVFGANQKWHWRIPGQDFNQES